jgi:hypothetical protein
MPRGISDPLQENSKLVSLLYNDPKFFYYSGNNNGSGLGHFVQTSYKYGHDRQGNGSSEQPYIATDIPNRLSTSPTDDGYIRGGWRLANQSSINDRLRINKFINDTPKGPLFIQRQIGLQLTNPKLETRKINLNSFGLLGSVLTTAFNVFNALVPGPTRLYNEGKNTLAQLPVTAFGTHFERHGLSPIQDDNTKYLAVVRNNNDNGNNRLLALKTKLIKPGITNPRKGNVILGTVNAILGAVNVFNTAIGKGTNPLLPTSPLLQPEDLIIDRYSGGPGSTYGVGFTTIRRYDVTSNGFNKFIPEKGKVDYTGLLGLSDQYFSPRENLQSNNIAQNNDTQNPFYINQAAVFYRQNTPAGANGTTFSPTSRTYAELRTQVEKQSKIDGKGLINYAETLGVSDIYFGSGSRDNFDLNHINGTGKPTQIDQAAVKYTQNSPAGAYPSSSSPSGRTYDELKKKIKTQSKVSGSVLTINYADALGVSDIYFDPKSNDNYDRNHINGISKPSQIDQTAVDYNKKSGYNAPAGANGTSTSPTSRLYNDLINQIKTSVTQSTNNGNGFFITSTATQNINKNSNLKTLLENVFTRTDSDLLTLHFRPIDPFGDNFNGYDIRFSAYMKGFKDNFDATWNEYNYVGRAESFYTYGRFKRNVSFNFDIPCFNKTQLLEKHRALGQLASTTAGSYNSNGLLGGVLLKVNVGKYLDNEYAILNNISYDIPDDSSWDIDEQLAMYLKVNVSLTIIHSKLPEYKVPEVNSDAGFFGYLSNPIKNGYLAR